MDVAVEPDPLPAMSIKSRDPYDGNVHMMSAEEARARGLGVVRGCLIGGLASLPLWVLLIYMLYRLSS